MVAQRLSRDVRWLVVAAPSYLERRGTPAHPNDLLNHRCIRLRIGDERIYRWEFERGSEKLEVNVPGSLVVDQGTVGLAAAKDGAGLMYVCDPMVRELVDQGLLQTVLDDWAPMGPGFHVYYSNHALPLRLGPLLAQHGHDGVAQVAAPRKFGAALIQR